MKSEQINDLAAALAKAQGAMKNAPFDKQNPHFRSKYASLASIRDTIKGPFSENGLSCSQATEVRDGGLVLVTTLMHASGQWLSSEYPLPIAAKPQELGSALTYARRYSLSCITGSAADDDDDGNAANGKDKDTGEVISEAQTDTIRKLIAETKSDVTKFLQWAGAESISDIRAAKFAEAIALLEAKKTQGKS